MHRRGGTPVRLARCEIRYGVVMRPKLSLRPGLRARRKAALPHPGHTAQGAACPNHRAFAGGYDVPVDLRVVRLDGPRPADETGAWSLKPTASPVLAELARQIITFPRVAGESQHLLEPRLVRWRRVVSEWREEPFSFNVGSGKSMLLAALSAERRWERTRRVVVHSRSELESWLRRTYSRARDWPTEPSTMERPPLLSSIPPFGGPAEGAVRRIAGVVEWCRSLWSAEDADWAARIADLAYWRRTADELWQLLSTRVGPPREPAEVVILESSPCGIRRLTAVRVPRAPGSWRAPSIPNVSVIAAA